MGRMNTRRNYLIAISGGILAGVLVGLAFFGIHQLTHKPTAPKGVATSSRAPTVLGGVATASSTDPVCVVVGAGNPLTRDQVVQANNEIDRLWGLYAGESDPIISAAIQVLHSSQHPDPDIARSEGPAGAAQTLVDNFNQFTQQIANECVGE